MRSTRKPVTNALPEDAIADIPANRVKFFGTAGRMLLPAVSTVASLIGEVPQGKVTTMHEVCRELTRRCGVQGTCPVTARKALLAVARGGLAPWWRVVKPNGGLMASLPGGAEAQAGLLRSEGHALAVSGGALPAEDFRQSLYRFE